MELSARNQIRGRIRSVRSGTVMAEVEVDAEASTIVAAITKGSVDRLSLREGDTVTLIVKATEVMIGK